MKGRNSSLFRKIKTIYDYQSVVIKLSLCLSLCTLLIFSFHAYSSEVYAATDSITISNDVDGKNVNDVTWKAYKVADYDAYGNIVIDNDFNASNIDISALTTSEEVGNAAKTFADIAVSKGVSIDGQAVSENGIAKITGIDQGVYLLVGSDVKIESKLYSPVPMIVEVIADSNGVNVDVVAKFYNPPEEESTMTVVIEPTTNKETENDSEDETEINETDEDETDEDEEDETEELTTKKGKEDDEKGSGGSSGNEGDLPQTGLLWWPVIPLFIIGIILVFIGVKIKNNGEDSEE